jgi:VHS domain
MPLATSSVLQTTPSILKFTLSSILSPICITLSRPKEASKYIKQRLLKKNPRIQWLALTLLDGAMTNCKLQFHSQVCTKDFMKGMITILNISDIPEQISNKVLSLVQKWATEFQHQQDILPLFGTVYEQLQKRGFKFPDSHEQKPLEIKQKPISADSHEVMPTTVSQASHAVPALLEGVYEAIMVANVRPIIRKL